MSLGMQAGIITIVVILYILILFLIVKIDKNKKTQQKSTNEHIEEKQDISILIKYKEMLENNLISQEEYDEKKAEYLENIEEASVKENNDKKQSNDVFDKKTNKKTSIMSRKLALVGVVLIIVGIIGGGYNLKEANYYRGRALSYNASDEYKEKGIYGSRVGIEQASGYVNLYDAYSYYNANNKYNDKIEKQRYYRDKEDTYKKYAYAFFGVSVFGVVLIIVDKRKISGKGKIKIQISKS